MRIGQISSGRMRNSLCAHKNRGEIPRSARNDRIKCPDKIMCHDEIKRRDRIKCHGQIKSFFRGLFILLLPALLFLPGLRATTLARLSLDQLAAGSDAVARVRCASTQSLWEYGTIWTVTTARVVENVKGNLPAQIALRLPGGRVGHLTASVEGTPKFQPGDEAFVFLKRTPAGRFTVAGWVEGTFRISRDPRTGSETVTQDSSAFAVFDTATRTFRAEGIRRMPIEEFRARLAAAVARAGEKSR